MVPKHAMGGIGDCLQCLESAMEENVIEVYSHFKNAPDIFTIFGIEVTRFEYYENIGKLHEIFVSGTPLPRKFYPHFIVPKSPFEKPIGRKVIGIHVEGSPLSNQFWRERGKPTKEMTKEFFIALINKIQEVYPKIVIYLFCSPNRTKELGNIAAEVIKEDFYIIGFPKIWDSLSCVAHCDVVIGVDSAIKTMSSILKKPTITLIGNYEDKFRDDNFIYQYVNDGIMHAIYFDNIDSVNVGEVVKLISL